MTLVAGPRRYPRTVIADLPSWLDAQFLRNASGLLVIAAALLALVLIFVLRSVVVRILSVLLVAAAVFGLVRYRQTLDHCAKHGCACKFFGTSVQGDRCGNGSG